MSAHNFNLFRVVVGTAVLALVPATDIRNAGLVWMGYAILGFESQYEYAEDSAVKQAPCSSQNL